MSSQNLPEWEKLLKHGSCDVCGATLDFDDICTECPEPWSVSEWGT